MSGYDWQDDALCAQVGGDEWFPEMGMLAVEAKRVCGRCEVAAQCLAYALSLPTNPPGVWGGLTPHERRALRRNVAA